MIKWWKQLWCRHPSLSQRVVGVDGISETHVCDDCGRESVIYRKMLLPPVTISDDLVGMETERERMERLIREKNGSQDD